ncbi:MAG: arginase family protein [Candidatus Thorarchaeota archaeon]|jgi:arginase
MRIAVVGVPFNGDGTTPEIENPAQSIRDDGLISILENKGHYVYDFGNLNIPSYTNKKDPTTKILNYDAWKEVSIRLSETLTEILDTDRFPMILGGDCSILMGIFDAYQAIDFPLNLFFLDGHADFHNIITSPSGEPADMELAALTGHLNDEVVYMTGRGPLLDEKNVVAYGINEYDNIGSSNIVVIDRKSITETGIEATFIRGINSLEKPDLPLWFHFDVDALDKTIMPAVNFPVVEGLSYHEALNLLTLIKNTNRLIGISVACYHPNIDHNKEGIQVLLSLLGEIL